MRRRECREREAGTAVVEFVVLALVLTVPVAFGVGAVLSIVDARMRAQDAASTAALVVARQGGGQPKVERVVHAQWDRPADVTTALTCSPWCGHPGATVTVAVTVGVDVPLIPRAVTISQEHSQVVDRFGSR